VQVVVLVGVEVVAGEARGAEGGELRRDLGTELVPGGAGGGEGQAEPGHVIAETAIRLDQGGDSVRRQGRRAVGQRQVQADGKARVAAGKLDALGRGRLADHQAGGGQHTLAVGCLDGGIDLWAEAKVVGVEDEAGAHGGSICAGLRVPGPGPRAQVT
jgi:hypothetical protein